jgi:hypothetical protein
MEPINISWAALKSFVGVRKTSMQIIEEPGVKYLCMAFDGQLAVRCDIAFTGDPAADGSDHADLLANYLATANRTPKQSVVTDLEQDNIDLALASDQGVFVDNICKLSLKIPGDVGQIGSRRIGGGYGFTDVFGWGDRVKDVSVVDKDFMYAGLPGFYAATPALQGIPDTDGLSWADVAPDGVELGSYIDKALDSFCQGWRLWCDDGNQGGVDIDPLGGLAKLPGGAYLVVTIEKTDTSAATRAALNAWWGKPST